MEGSTADGGGRATAFVVGWLNGLGLANYLEWFVENDYGAAEGLRRLATMPGPELEAEIARLNAAHPSGVLCNPYGHGALFRAALQKVGTKMNAVVAEGAGFFYDDYVRITPAAQDDPDDAYGPLSIGEVGIIVDVAEPKRLTGRKFKVQALDERRTFWYREASLERTVKPVVESTMPPADADNSSPPPVPSTPPPAVDYRNASYHDEVDGGMMGFGPRGDSDAANARPAASAAAVAVATAIHDPTTDNQTPATSTTDDAGDSADVIFRTRPRYTTSSKMERRSTVDRELDDLGFLFDEDAATKIQATFRGYIARKQLGTAKQVNVETSDVDEVADMLEGEDSWVEQKLADLNCAAPIDRKLTLPSISLQLAKMIGLKKALAAREDIFTKESNEWINSCPPNRKASISAGVAEVKKRYEDAYNFASSRKKDLEALKVNRLSELASSKAKGATIESRQTRPPNPKPVEQVAIDDVNAAAIESIPPATVSTATGENLSDRAEDSGTPCAILLRSVDRQTLDQIVALLQNKSTGDIVEFAASGQHRVSLANGANVLRRSFGDQVTSTDSISVFQIPDVNATAEQLAHSTSQPPKLHIVTHI